MAGLAEVTVAGCVDGCAHEWGNKQIIKTGNNPSNRSTLYSPGELNPGHAAQNYGKQTVQTVSQGQFCRLCGGWRGSLGLEPTPLMFISHLVSIFREVHRVLRTDGTCFLNLGSSYATNPGNGRGGEKVAGGKPHRSGRDKTGAGFKQKDLVPIPWMVAMALQADGWWLRSDIIWAKGLSFATHETTCGHCGKKHEARYSGSCMPESCRDRPTKSHEYVFLLSKSERYFWDQEVIKESCSENTHTRGPEYHRQNKTADAGQGIRQNESFQSATWGPVSQRNVRTVWAINPASFKKSHFATFSPALVEPMIKASTSEKGVCPKCKAPWERVTEKGNFIPMRWKPGDDKTQQAQRQVTGRDEPSKTSAMVRGGVNEKITTGWQPTCQCNAGAPVPATVADIFAGAMTTNLVAERLGRDSVAFELSPEYVTMGINRCFQDAPLFTKIEVKK
jgi:hypothetical protein